MAIAIWHPHSRPGETRRGKFSSWFGFSRRLRTAALLLAFTSACSGSSAAREIGSTQGQKTEIPFDLYNGNLIIVKATVGSFKNVNLILDTGTSPTAINQVMADRLNVRGKLALLQTLNGTSGAKGHFAAHPDWPVSRGFDHGRD
jgi:hypothetical protein